jgi:hypothetical protein
MAPVKKKKTSKPVKARPASQLHSLKTLEKELTRHTDQFCKELLNKEYRDMCRVMARGLCVENSPARQGDLRTWAAAIVGAVGFVNFLHDPKLPLHYKKSDLARKLGVPLSSFNKHTKALIDGFDLIPFDPDFTLPSMISINPLIAMATSPTLLDECCSAGSCCAENGCDPSACEKDVCCQNEPAMKSRKKTKKK